MLSRIIRFVGVNLPFNWLRCCVLKSGGLKIGSGSVIERHARIGRAVKIGCGVMVSRHSFIGGGVEIGDGSKVGKYAYIGTDVVLGKKVVVGGNAYISCCKIGDCSFIESFVRFTGFKEGHITIGSNSYVGLYCVLDWSGGIEIGDSVHIAGPSVGVWTHTSVFQCSSGDPINEHSKKKVGGVKIGNFTYIGGNSTVYPGVEIGEHCIILPNSAVDKNVESGAMVGGVPAKKVVVREDKGYGYEASIV